jgi:hypothetical protein
MPAIHRAPVAISIVAMLVSTIGLSHLAHGEDTTLSLADWKFLEGEWEGELTSLDYKDNRTRVTIGASVEFRLRTTGVWFRFTYVEPNGKTTLGDPGSIRISKDAKGIIEDNDEWRLVSKSVQDAKIEIVVERMGVEDRKPAMQTRTYLFDGTTLTIQTKVDREKDERTLIRNTYKLRKRS